MVGPRPVEVPAARHKAAPIDPRIQARRIEVQRVQGRRRLRRLVDLGLVALVATGFAGALWTPLLDVDAVMVDGAARTGADTVRERSGISLGEPLIDVDLRAAGRRIGALPWVERVVLHRRVDGVVSISVAERTPVAAVGSGASAMLVDRDGRVLAPVDTAPDVDGLPMLTGVEAVPPAGSFLDGDHRVALRLAEELGRVVRGAVTSVAGQPLSARLAQGGDVHFGEPSQLDAKVRSLQTVLDQVDLRCLAVLDLQLPGSPVLTREEPCS